MNKKQVDKAHYRFHNYISKKRFISVWHQLNEVLSVNPKSVLEIGLGPGIFKCLAEHFGISVVTVDIDAELNPNCVATANDLPFKNDVFDCVCAFQVLEHLPYEHAVKAFGEMTRVAKGNIIISLPDAKKVWVISLHITKRGQKIIHFKFPRFWLAPHEFDGEHYWEINKLGYPLEKIIDDFSSKNVNMIKTYRIKEFPYHRFFVFKKI